LASSKQIPEETILIRLSPLGSLGSVKENVLLIGEDSRFMETLSERICSKGVAVSLAQTASEALTILRRDDIDVVVINFNDLGANGIRILDSIKKETKTLAEFITLTSPSTIHWSIEGMKRGAFADLLIPFDLEDLLAKLREAGTKKKSKKVKVKKSIRKRIEDLMVSATLAESGDFFGAKQILTEVKEEISASEKEEQS
jgi:DNA-binding NtrC family response regulator